jgi:hypothetical protein
VVDEAVCVIRVAVDAVDGGDLGGHGSSGSSRFYAARRVLCLSFVGTDGYVYVEWCAVLV